MGRDRIARAVPDSTSPLICGAATKTAAIASTKLNMNIVRMRNCDAMTLTCTSGSGVPRWVIVGMREKPQPVSAMTMSVRMSSASSSRRRAASRMTSRAITSPLMGAASPAG